MAAEQSAAMAQNTGQSVALKRAGQSCITLFVVFLVVLLAFGRTPLVRMQGEGGSSVHFDFISCLGVAMGVYALCFFLTKFTTILRLAPAKKILGLIGGLGLIAHAAIAVLHPFGPASTSSMSAIGAGGNHVLMHSGAEDWMIDGKNFHILGSYLMQLPQGAQYTIEYPCDLDFSGPVESNPAAIRTAFQLMRHAYQEELYKRMHASKIGSGEVPVARIGVVLFQGTGGDFHGYRIGLSLDEIQKRMEQTSAP